MRKLEKQEDFLIPTRLACRILQSRDAMTYFREEMENSASKASGKQEDFLIPTRLACRILHLFSKVSHSIPTLGWDGVGVSFSKTG